MTTLREHLEAIVERNAPTRPHHNPGDDYRDAVAALAILNDSAPQCLDNPPHCSHRIVPDPPVSQ